jgi:ATP/maltotriose-dependent transcriptional regulator MalT
MVAPMCVEGDSAFVGRTQHRITLRRISRHIESGHPGLVVINGDAGVGKSRLVKWLQAEPAESDWTFRCGECTPGVGPSLPYGPWKAAFGAAAAASWQGAEPRTLDQIGDLVLDLLADRAAAGPVGLVLEDLHWADRSSVELLAYVVRGLAPESRVLVCVTVRDEVDPGETRHVDGVLAELLRLERTFSVPLGRLSEAEACELARALCPDGTEADRLAAIARRSGGNPYFLRQLAEADPDETLPPTLRGVLGHRLEQLGDKVGAVVDAVALAAVPVPHQVLAYVLGSPPDLNALLRTAQRARVIEVVDDRYDIANALLREVAVAAQLPGERAALHAALAAAFVHTGPDRDRASWLGLVAEHWSASGQVEEALEADAAAAAAAAADGAHPFAQRLYGRALDRAARAADQVRVAALRRGCAREAYLAGDAPTAVALYTDLLADSGVGAAEAIGLRLDLASALRASGDIGRMTDELARAYADAAGLAPSVVVVRTHALHAGVLMLTGEYGAAIAAVRTALPLLDQVGDGDVTAIRAHLLNSLGVATGRTGDLDRALDLLAEALELAEAAGSHEDICRTYTNTGFLLEHAGRYAEAATAALSGWDYAQAHQVGIAMVGLMLCNTVDALYFLGRWPEAEAQLAIALRRPLAPEAMAGVHHCAAALALGRGELTRAHAHLDAALTVAESVAARQFHAQLGELRADTALAERDPHAALRITREALDAYGGSGDTLARRLVVVGLRALTDLSMWPEALRQLSREQIDETGRGLLALAGPAEGEQAVRLAAFERAEVEQCELEYARLRGTDDPLGWQRLATAWVGLGRPWTAAYACVHGAEAAHRRGRKHRHLLVALLTDAQRLLRPLGAPVLLGNRIAELLQQADVAPALEPVGAEDGPARRARDVGLTAREMQVLPLLAAGKRNREIARALFISEKTASVHVSNIMAKLQAATRGAAVDSARQLGLLAGAPS